MMATRAVLLLGITATAAMSLAPVSDSALPLSNKRILLPMSRTEAGQLAGQLVLAGARPLWCPAVRWKPMADLDALDDALMRITEFDILVLLGPNAIDTVAERWLALADGSVDMVQAMLEASKIEIGVVGTDAQRFRARLGASVSVAPIGPSARALAVTLCDLGHVRPGTKVLVTAGRVEGAALEDLPRDVESVLEQLTRDGASVERVDTHLITLSPAAEMQAELGVLAGGHVDVICAGSAEELAALCLAAADADGTLSVPLVVAMGEEVAAAAAQLMPSAEVLQVGARVRYDVVVEKLEKHFGAGKLLF